MPRLADRPMFSVVVAAHNAARTLPSTVRSVLAQTRHDFEVVIVDDGSTDGTAEALREATTDPRVIDHRQDNLGPAEARNAGVERSHGEYVSLLDSDDLWLPGYLQAMADAFAENPAAGLVFADAWRLDEATRRIHRRTIMSQQHPPHRPPSGRRQLLAALLERNFVYTSATIRRDAVLEAGGFRTLTRSEDYELWLRLAALGTQFARARGTLAVYRDRPGSRNHDAAAMLRGRGEIYDLVLASYDLEPELREVAEERRRATSVELSDLEQAVAEQHRPLLGLVGRRLREHRLYRVRPPREVARAFPDLKSV